MANSFAAVGVVLSVPKKANNAMLPTTQAMPRVTVIDPRTPEKAKLRVAAYCRVSSDSADQFNSGKVYWICRRHDSGADRGSSSLLLKSQTHSRMPAAVEQADDLRAPPAMLK